MIFFSRKTREVDIWCDVWTKLVHSSFSTQVEVFNPQICFAFSLILKLCMIQNSCVSTICQFSSDLEAFEVRTGRRGRVASAGLGGGGVWGCGGEGAPSYCSISRAVCGEHGDRYEVQNCQLCESLKTFLKDCRRSCHTEYLLCPQNWILGT